MDEHIRPDSVLLPPAGAFREKVCLGTGLELDEIFRLRPDISVTGIDLEPAMLERLKAKHRDRDRLSLEYPRHSTLAKPASCRRPISCSNVRGVSKWTNTSAPIPFFSRVIRDDPFVDDWTEEDYRKLVACLQNTLATGGFVYAAFRDGALKGFASVEAALFGGEQGYSPHSNWQS